MSVYDQLPKPFFVLAPMDDVTDTVFRQIITDCAPPDLFFTEFVNVDGLQSPGRPKLLRKLQFTTKEKPIIAQLWGKIPENYRKTASELKAMGFEGIDLNMGCPVKAVVKNGCCSALIDNRDLAVSIIKATKAGAGELPVSVKTRLGSKEIDLSWHELLLKQKLDALIIHGRTAKEMSKVPANWEAIGKIRELRDKIAPQTKIIGNGDVMTIQQAKALAKKYKLDGIMIGRGIFHNPFLFGDGETWKTYSKVQKIALYRKHVELFAKTWQSSGSLYDSHVGGVQGNNEKRTSRTSGTVSESRKQLTQQSATNGGRVSGPARKQADVMRNIQTLNKFCKIYINDFDGAKELREKLMKTDTIDQLLVVLR